MEFLIESLIADWQAFLRFAPRLIYGLVLLIVFLFGARLMGRFAAGIFERRSAITFRQAFSAARGDLGY